MDTEIYEAFWRIPALEGVVAREAVMERLGGLTNKNYRVEADGKSYVLRIPGKGTSEYIDRRVEEHNARAAAEAGVNAPIVFFDATDGLMLTRFLEGCETMSPESFAARPGVPARAGQALKRMHTSGERFRFRSELMTEARLERAVPRFDGSTLFSVQHDRVEWRVCC